MPIPSSLGENRLNREESELVKQFIDLRTTLAQAASYERIKQFTLMRERVQSIKQRVHREAIEADNMCAKNASDYWDDYDTLCEVLS